MGDPCFKCMAGLSNKSRHWAADPKTRTLYARAVPKCQLPSHTVTEATHSFLILDSVGEERASGNVLCTVSAEHPNYRPWHTRVNVDRGSGRTKNLAMLTSSAEAQEVLPISFTSTLAMQQTDHVQVGLPGFTGDALRRAASNGPIALSLHVRRSLFTGATSRLHLLRKAALIAKVRPPAPASLDVNCVEV